MTKDTKKYCLVKLIKLIKCQKKEEIIFDQKTYLQHFKYVVENLVFFKVIYAHLNQFSLDCTDQLDNWFCWKLRMSFAGFLTRQNVKKNNWNLTEILQLLFFKRLPIFFLYRKYFLNSDHVLLRYSTCKWSILHTGKIR